MFGLKALMLEKIEQYLNPLFWYIQNKRTLVVSRLVMVMR